MAFAVAEDYTAGMKYRALMTVALALSSCQMAPSKDAPRDSVAIAGELPRRNTDIDRSAKSCSKPLYCGDVGYADCGSAADGPAYYFERKTGKIITTCGGACMYDPNGRCKRECPPAGWVCRTR